MTVRRAVFAAVLLGVVLAGTIVPAAAQCAMCKTALTNSGEGQAVGGELNRAILVMMAAPYLVFGTLALVLFRKPLRERLARLRSRAGAAS
jgi:hypothetical protein